MPKYFSHFEVKVVYSW